LLCPPDLLWFLRDFPAYNGKVRRPVAGGLGDGFGYGGFRVTWTFGHSRLVAGLSWECASFVPQLRRIQTCVAAEKIVSNSAEAIGGDHDGRGFQTTQDRALPGLDRSEAEELPFVLLVTDQDCIR
jgi:hypothetical protein